MERIPFAKVCCDGNEAAYIQQVLDSGWLTTASKAQLFEQKFREAVGAKHACAVNSCTAALHLALVALGVGPGQRVFVPTLTFTATAEVVRHVGAEPVLIDVDYATGLVTPEILEAAIEAHPDVKVLMVVHYAGHPARMHATGHLPGIVDVCRAHGIRIVEDAAHAFPTRADEKHMIGNAGDITCFSFYANKTITTGEGGMVTTNDDEIAKRVNLMRLHGIDRDAWDRYTSTKPAWEYDVIAAGFKYNMPDINAAIGLAQLERAEAMRSQRQRCAERYYELLAHVPAIDLPRLAVPPAWHAWHLFWIVLNDQATVGRNELIEQLSARGISTSVHYKPLHRMTYYRKLLRPEPSEFPNAERIWAGCLSLPLFSSMTDKQVDRVCATLGELLAVKRAPAATARA